MHNKICLFKIEEKEEEKLLYFGPHLKVAKNPVIRLSESVKRNCCPKVYWMPCWNLKKVSCFISYDNICGPSG